MRKQYDKQSKECTFQPKVSPKSHKLLNEIEENNNNNNYNHIPIWKRTAIDLAKREMSNARAQEMYDPNVRECTFKPNIETSPHYRFNKEKYNVNSDNDSNDDDEDDESPSIITRLTEGNEKPINKQLKRRIAWEEEIKERCPFKPHINEISNKIVEQKYNNKGDFIQRQQYYELEKIKRENKMRERENMNYTQKYTFKPEIGNAEEVLIYKRPDLVLETEEERIERLSKKDFDKTQNIRKKVADEYYGQFSFHPDVNKKSKLLARSSSCSKLYNSDKEKEERLKKLEEEKERKYREECTFKPDLHYTKKQNELVDDYYRNQLKYAEKTYNNLREKEKLIIQNKREKEMEELKECTFKPKIQPPPKKGDKLVLVNGLGRYLEITELARRKKEEQKKREEKVFTYGKKPLQPFTIPQPFNLS